MRKKGWGSRPAVPGGHGERGGWAGPGAWGPPEEPGVAGFCSSDSEISSKNGVHSGVAGGGCGLREGRAAAGEAGVWERVSSCLALPPCPGLDQPWPDTHWFRGPKGGCRGSNPVSRGTTWANTPPTCSLKCPRSGVCRLQLTPGPNPARHLFLSIKFYRHTGPAHITQG